MELCSPALLAHTPKSLWYRALTSNTLVSSCPPPPLPHSGGMILVTNPLMLCLLLLRGGVPAGVAPVVASPAVVLPVRPFTPSVAPGPGEPPCLGGSVGSLLSSVWEARILNTAGGSDKKPGNGGEDFYMRKVERYYIPAPWASLRFRQLLRCRNPRAAASGLWTKWACQPGGTSSAAPRCSAPARPAAAAPVPALPVQCRVAL